MSRPRPGVLEGWRLFGLLALGVASLLALILALVGTDERGLRILVRASARTSATLFLLAFSASGLRRFLRSPFTAWLLRNRRYVGVSFAFSHLVHLAIVASLAISFPHPFYEQSVNLVVMGGGGVVTLFVVAMAATSFDRTAAWLGPRRWKLLHTVGGYSIWGVFAFDYVQLAFRSPLYVPMALAVLGTLGLRMAARVQAMSPSPTLP
jgi:sulfoxide reductase heme-binding subunit YedZ